MTIKTGHRVRSADGTLYDVRYVNKDRQTADLSVVNATGVEEYDRTELPLAELRRVTITKRTPIEGVPEQRPRCPYCDKPLRPSLKNIRADGTDRWHTPDGKRNPTIKRVFEHWRGYLIERDNDSARFCTLDCARYFANAAFRAGYRITRKGQST